MFFGFFSVGYDCLFFNETATTEIYTYVHTLSLHDALPISLLLLVAAWVGLLPGAVWVWTLLLVATQAAPLWCELLGLVTRATTKPTRAWSRLRAARSEEHTSDSSH